MTTELKTLFQFQYEITEMQMMVLQARANGRPQSQIDTMIERIDKLIEIYRSYDRFYFQAHIANQKILALEHDNMDLANQIIHMKSEIEKLSASENWN